jgi:thymidylate synthase (FAD)
MALDRFTKIPVLDKGFITVLDFMGDDTAIVEAARVSYDKGTRTTRDDKNLIRYLMKNSHTSPFEMCEIKLHLKMPMFVARQWQRHRMASINERSARYSILTDEFYIPDEDDICSQSVLNNQGRGNGLPTLQQHKVCDQIDKFSESAYELYCDLLNVDGDGVPQDNGETGVAREIGRMVLPSNVYTEFFWKIDLHNLLHFLKLRMDQHAQKEIRNYANAIFGIVKEWVPITAQAFQDYKIDAVTLSAPALAIVRKFCKGEDVQQEDSGLSQREWAELMEIFDRT